MKRIVIMFLIILFSINVFLCVKINNDKKYICDVLGVKESNDITLLRTWCDNGPGADPYYIQFIISKKNYDKNGLIYTYGEYNSPEVQNTKKDFINSYICTYSKVMYDNEMSKELSNIIFTRNCFYINFILLFGAFISYIKINNSKKKEVSNEENKK